MGDTARLFIPTHGVSKDQRHEHVCYGIYPRGLQTIVHASLTYDYSLRQHLLATNKMAWLWSDILGLDVTRRQLFVSAALLHDVGKILLPKPIVLKPGPLDDEEYRTIREHVGLGDRVVRSEPGFGPVADLVSQHHEWVNGNGYPRGRIGSEIDPLARALSVVDAFSAMTDERPYHRRQMTHEDALEELERCAGTQFDEFYVASFTRMKRQQSAALRTA
jgi:HD-GYP domain-containing protein (c-di-GMP phosphodiesterase class II)